MTTFRYPRFLLAEDDNDTACIGAQIKRAHAQLNSVARALKQDGADAYVMLRFYLAMVQAVLLYGADSWTISARNMEVLESFDDHVIRHITGCHI